jgi:hypothetical protein
MKPCALIIPGDGLFGETISRGYTDALAASGWDVIHYRAICKLEVIEFIERFGVRLILAQCGTGTRQLPIDAINANGIAVALQVLPFNARHEPLAGSYIDPSEPEITGLVHRCLLHTPFHWRALDPFFHRWTEMDLPVLDVPLAGNLCRALPSNLTLTHDIAIAGEFSDRPDVMLDWALPLLKRLRHCSFRIYGDQAWQSVGVSGIRPMREAYANMADFYARATACPNLHSAVERPLLLNEQAYLIQLCGGRQITDSSLAAEMFGAHVRVAANPTEMILAIEAMVHGRDDRLAGVVARVKQAAEKHTYFNRLTAMLGCLGLREEAALMNAAHERMRGAHVTTIERMLNSGTIGGIE